MSDWVVEISRISGQGQVDTRSVTLQDFDDPKVAKLVGIEECLKWANEEGSPIPSTALDFWKVACRTMQDYEALTELETRFGITATIQSWTVPIPRAIAQEPERAKLHRPSAHTNGMVARSVSFKDALMSQLEFLQGRQKELIVERKRLDDEYEANGADISEIRSFMMLRAGRRRRHAVRTRRTGGQGAQPENQPDSRKDLS